MDPALSGDRSIAAGGAPSPRAGAERGDAVAGVGCGARRRGGNGGASSAADATAGSTRVGVGGSSEPVFSSGTAVETKLCLTRAACSSFAAPVSSRPDRATVAPEVATGAGPHDPGVSTPSDAADAPVGGSGAASSRAVTSL
jgi:hypothetical protein